MITNGQTINYNKYMNSLRKIPAPILGSQLPNSKINLAGLMEYARKKGVKAGDLSEAEKNQFIENDTVQSLQSKVQKSIKYSNIAEWNSKSSNIVD